MWLGREEEQFGRTLEQGTRLLDEHIARARDRGLEGIGAEEAFQLHDTYGFPFELTARARGRAGHGRRRGGLRARDGDRARARALRGRARGRRRRPRGDRGVRERRGLRRPSSRATRRLEQATAVGAIAVQDGQVLAKLVESPFYATGGGQVADVGVIQLRGRRLRGARRRRRSALGDDQALVLEPVRGELHEGERVVARVDAAARRATAGQPHRDAPAARGAARAPRRPRPPGRLLRRPGQAALRLHPRRAAERRGPRVGRGPRQRVDPRQRPRARAHDDARRGQGARRDGAVRREVRRRRADGRDRRRAAGRASCAAARTCARPRRSASSRSRRRPRARPTCAGSRRSPARSRSRRCAAHDRLLHDAAVALRTAPENVRRGRGGARGGARAQLLKGAQGGRRAVDDKARARSSSSTACARAFELRDLDDPKALPDLADRDEGPARRPRRRRARRGRRGPREPARGGHARRGRARREGRRRSSRSRRRSSAAAAAAATRWPRPAASEPEKLPEALAGRARGDRASARHALMRVLALDYGSARCGVARQRPDGHARHAARARPAPGTRKGFGARRRAGARARRRAGRRRPAALAVRRRLRPDARDARVRRAPARRRAGPRRAVRRALHDLARAAGRGIGVAGLARRGRAARRLVDGLRTSADRRDDGLTHPLPETE